LVGWRMCIRPL